MGDGRKPEVLFDDGNVKVTRPKRMPDYDPEALRAAIERFDKSIEVFEAEIEKLMKQKMEYKKLLLEAESRG